MNTEGKITKSSNTIPNIYKAIGAAEWLVTVFAAMILTYLTILVLLFQANAENSVLTYANVFFASCGCRCHIWNLFSAAIFSKALPKDKKASFHPYACGSTDGCRYRQCAVCPTDTAAAFI